MYVYLYLCKCRESIYRIIAHITQHYYTRIYSVWQGTEKIDSIENTPAVYYLDISHLGNFAPRYQTRTPPPLFLLLKFSGMVGSGSMRHCRLPLKFKVTVGFSEGLDTLERWMHPV